MPGQIYLTETVRAERFSRLHIERVTILLKVYADRYPGKAIGKWIDFYSIEAFHSLHNAEIALISKQIDGIFLEINGL